MNTPTNYGDTLWRDAHGAFVVLPIAPPSLQTRYRRQAGGSCPVDGRLGFRD